MKTYNKKNETTIQVLIPREPQEFNYTKDDLIFKIANIEAQIEELEEKKKTFQDYLKEAEKLKLKLKSEVEEEVEVVE